MSAAPQRSVEHVVPRDHPAFEGHFPGRPLLPGVALLAEALAAVTEATGTTEMQWTVAQV
jgi:3-hydroxymyristoyl/3-hydroxydecanoyl-(acyl carrier protein) dehydratase